MVQFFIVRLLFSNYTVEEYAIISFPLIISSFAPFLEFGAGKACIDVYNKKKDLQVYYSLYSFFLVFGLLITVPLVFLYYYFNNFDLWLSISISASISLLAQLINFINVSYLDLNKKYHKVYIGQIISTLVFFLFTMYVVKNDFKMRSLVFIYTIQPVILLIYFLFIIKFKFIIKSSKFNASDFYRPMIKHGVTSSLSALTIPIARVLSSSISPTLYAIFDIGMKFSQIGSSGVSIFTNHLYGLFNNHTKIKNYINLSYKLILLNILGSILFFIFSDIVYGILEIELSKNQNILPILIMFALTLGLCTDPIFKYKLFQGKLIIPIIIKLVPHIFIVLSFMYFKAPILGLCFGFIMYSVLNLIYGYVKK